MRPRTECTRPGGDTPIQGEYAPAADARGTPISVFALLNRTDSDGGLRQGPPCGRWVRRRPFCGWAIDPKWDRSSAVKPGSSSQFCAIEGMEMTTIGELTALVRAFLAALDTYWELLGESDNAPGVEEAAAHALEEARGRLEAALADAPTAGAR